MPDLLPEERAVMGYQQRQAAAEKRQASALALASRLDADARSAKTELRAADLRRQAQAARDAAAAAQEDSSTAGNLAAQFSEKAAVRKTEMAKADENRKAMRDLSIVVKQNGDPRVIGAFLRALKEGASPEAAELIVTGTMKTKDWERAQAAKTPEQEAARKKAEQVALRDQGLTPEGKLPDATKPEKSMDETKADAALKKLEGKDGEHQARIVVDIPTDELGALFRKDSTSPSLKTTIKAELDKRRAEMSPEAFNDALYGYRKGGGASGPDSAAPSAPVDFNTIDATVRKEWAGKPEKEIRAEVLRRLRGG